MGFHVGFKLALLASWPALIPAAIGLICGMCGLFIRRKAKVRAKRTVGVVIVVTGLIMMSITLLIPLSLAGTGWTVNEDTLTVRTGFTTVKWPLTSLNSSWVSPDSPYRPVVRTGGYSGGQFRTGRFRLANGANALVFQYGEHPWLLIRHEGANPVLISSPNVTHLEQILAEHSGANSAGIGAGEVTRPGQGWAVFVSVMLSILFAFWQWILSKTWQPKMPDRMITHWNFAGQPDGWLSKKIAMWIGIVVSLFLSVLSVVIVAAGAPILLLIPFMLLQFLFAFLFRWMYKQNVTETKT